MPRTLFHLFETWTTNVIHGRGKDGRKVIHYTICWILWKEGNGRVFGGLQKSAAESIDLVKQLVVLWSSDPEAFIFVAPSLVWNNWEALMLE